MFLKLFLSCGLGDLEVLALVYGIIKHPQFESFTLKILQFNLYVYKYNNCKDFQILQ